MKDDFSLSQNEDVRARVNLLIQLESGIQDGLKCPSCGRDSVSVWYSMPFAGEYRTWFICSVCDFRMRAQNSGKPSLLREDRIKNELEAEREV